MMKSLSAVLLFCGSLLLGAGTALGAEASRQCTVDRTPPGAAEKALRHGDYKEAETLYLGELAARPENVAATVGLARTELEESRTDEALKLVKKALADHPADARLLDALGEVEMRRGEPDEAAKALDAAGHADTCLGQVHFDFARYLELSGMAATAKRQLSMAHILSPEDPAISAEWERVTAKQESLKEQVTRLQARLDAADATAEQKSSAAAMLKTLRSVANGSCQPVQAVGETTLKMVSLMNGPDAWYGVGLEVQFNGRHKRLQLDTGASGLLLTRSAAASAGLLPEGEMQTGGIGDAGPANGFVTHVDDIRIGGLEFRNCLVRVVDRRGALDIDGLIGSDVFSNYQVTLDMPLREVRLKTLPARPDGAAKADGLITTGEGEGGTDEAPAADRYIAPEMKGWTRVYRRGHMLIVPTQIGKAPTKLFILDTGASTGLISPEAAREVTKVWGDESMEIRGISGKVKKVSEADSVTIQFGHVRQRLREMSSIDTSGISRGLGVGISGFIGFPTLKELVVSIDYRDDLIDVSYDPAHGYHQQH